MSRSPVSFARRESGRPLAPLRGATVLPLPSTFARNLTPIPAPAAHQPSPVVRSHIVNAELITDGTEIARQGSERISASTQAVARRAASPLPPLLPSTRRVTPIPAPAARLPSVAPQLPSAALRPQQLAARRTSALAQSHVLPMTWLDDSEILRDTVVFRPRPLLLPTAVEQTTKNLGLSGIADAPGSPPRAHSAARPIALAACVALGCLLAAVAIAYMVRDGWTIDLVRQTEDPLQLTYDAQTALSTVVAAPSVPSRPSQHSEGTAPDVSSLPLEPPEGIVPDVSSLPLEPSDDAASNASSLPSEPKSKRSRASKSRFKAPASVAASRSLVNTRHWVRTRRH